MSRLSKIGFLPKLLAVCLSILFVHDIIWGVWVYDRVHAEYRQGAETQAREEVEIACSVVDYWYGLESAGSLSRDEAQASAVAELARLEHQSGGAEGHFWVTDYQPVLIADARRPDLVGTNVGNTSDGNGDFFFRNAVDLAAGSGEGYVSSAWADSSGAPAPTLSYVRAFSPWGWVIGTETDVSKNISSSLDAMGLSILLLSIAFVCVFMYWVVIRNALSRPLAALVRTSEALAEGDVAQQVDVSSQDEMGTLAAAYARAVSYMNEMAQATSRLASGDLTVQVAPKSERDVLGNAHAQLAARQRELIGKMKTAASNVAEASGQLSRASEQTAQATQQITTSVQSVARGATIQSSSLQQTSNAMEELTAAIESIAQGARAQTESLERATSMVREVSVAIAEVSTNAEVGAVAWGETAASAAEGARMTHETVNGMDRIKKAMDLVSVRVSDLGGRSEEIGDIVATIDDIAAQTNLLALNAAIEAARAGEQGRGFAVVADEVRKLAERSSGATKEIAVLVTGIQTSVREAVNAMQQGSREIESGYQLANEAGASLDIILQKSRVAGDQVERISKASKQVTDISSRVVSEIVEISRVVEENAAATNQMKGTARSAAESVDGSTAVAQENGAAAQEVSASIEEVSAQMEETLAAAHSLSDMSEDMARAVAAFKVH